MIDTEALKRKILDLAIRGKLVPQDPNDEPASELLKRIKNERDRLIDEGKIKGKKDDFSYIFKGDDNCYYEKKGKEIRNITDEIPFVIPDSWAWSRIGSYSLKVTDFVASGSFKSLRENVAYYKKPNYALMIKTQDFQNNFSEDLTYTDEHGYNFLSNSNLYGGELILSNVGSVGKVYIVPHFNLKMTLAPNSIMVRFFDESLNLYLYYLLQSKFGYTCLKNITSATAIQKFNKTDFKTILVPIPPKNEQLRIINSLNTLSSKLDEINNLNVQIQLVKSQIKNKIIKLGIQGKLLNSDDNYYSKNIKLKDCGQLLSGRDLELKFINNEKRGIPYITGASQISDNNNLIINRWTNYPTVISQLHDVLITVKGTIGKTAINNVGNIHIARQIMAFKSETYILPEYILLVFQNNVNSLNLANNSLIPGIKRDNLLNIKFPLFSIQKQREICSLNSKCFELLNTI